MTAIPRPRDAIEAELHTIARLNDDAHRQIAAVREHIQAHRDAIADLQAHEMTLMCAVDGRYEKASRLLDEMNGVRS